MSKIMKNLEINIGFFGGRNIVQVGNISLFLCFFNGVKKIIENDKNFEKDFYSLICNRFYKKYIREEDLNNTTKAMNLIEEKFKCLPVNNSNFFEETQLLFSSYNKCLEYTEFIYKKHKKYIPIRIVISDLPYCAIDTERSLEKLDAWDGPPFWTRFYLKEFYDQGKDIPELPF